MRILERVLVLGGLLAAPLATPAAETPTQPTELQVRWQYDAGG